MDILQEKMQNTDFVWAYRNDISFEGKDEHGNRVIETGWDSVRKY